MDDFKKKMMKRIGPGGLSCPCCNPSRGKLKNSHVGKDNSLNKQARRRLKEELQCQLKTEMATQLKPTNERLISQHRLSKVLKSILERLNTNKITTTRKVNL